MGTTREQNGWYPSVKHDGNLDGNVTKLIPNPSIVIITPNPDKDIPLNNGKNGLVREKFIDCGSPKCVIKIITDPPLKFEPSEYVVSCTENNSSQWAGIGKAGNILSIKPKVNEAGKMDW